MGASPYDKRNSTLQSALDDVRQEAKRRAEAAGRVADQLMRREIDGEVACGEPGEDATRHSSDDKPSDAKQRLAAKLDAKKGKTEEKPKGHWMVDRVKAAREEKVA